MSKILATLDLDSLPCEIEPLHQVIKTLATELAASLARCEALQQQVLDLRRRAFRASSEQRDGQGDLFREPVTLPVPPIATEVITYERPKRGRPRLPKDLPRERVNSDRKLIHPSN